MVDVLIRNLDGEAYRKAKVLAAQLGVNVGEVVSESIRSFSPKPKKKGLGAVGVYDLGPKARDLSSRIDELAYGD